MCNIGVQGCVGLRSLEIACFPLVELEYDAFCRLLRRLAAVLGLLFVDFVILRCGDNLSLELLKLV